MSRITEFIAYLHSHIGDAYVWGAQGQNLSEMTPSELEAFIERRETSSKNEQRVRNFIAKATKEPLYAFDCSGIIMYWFQNVKGWSGDATANTLYNQCTIRGELYSNTALEPGDLLFIWDPDEKKMRHVGVVVDDANSIEAYGRDKGVVKLPISAGEWTHWGRHPLLQAEDRPAPEPSAKVITLTTPYMRGNDIKALQAALNALGYNSGEADGIAGSKTIAAIKSFAQAHGAEKIVAEELPEAVECVVNVNGKKYLGMLKEE